MKPLPNHFSEETAVVVNDYPYGRLRCQMKFWLEVNETRGTRLCTRSVNPKTGRLNKTHHSTYHLLGAELYEDEKGHVQVKGLGQYSSIEEMFNFFSDFPDHKPSAKLVAFLIGKQKIAIRKAEGIPYFSINNVLQPVSDDDRAEGNRELELLKTLVPQVIKLYNDSAL